MTKYNIENWCANKPITVEMASAESIAKYGPLIHITQSGGSMEFQHSMTPDQARQMAQALVNAALEAESIAVGVAA